MQIRFTPRRGTPEMDISGIVGGHALARWQAGQAREINEDDQVMFTGADGVTRKTKAIDVVFSCGPDFVDAATGKNPLFVCSDCGEDALDDAHLDRQTGTMVPYRVESDAHKPRLCVACYLARYPQYVVAHRAAGCPEAILSKATERANRPQPRPAAPPAPKAEPKPATSTTEEK